MNIQRLVSGTQREVSWNGVLSNAELGFIVPVLDFWKIKPCFSFLLAELHSGLRAQNVPGLSPLPGDLCFLLKICIFLDPGDSEYKEVWN